MKKILLIAITIAVLSGCGDSPPDDPDDGETNPELYIKAYIEPDFNGTAWTANIMLVENAVLYSNGSVSGDFAENATVSIAGETVTDVSAFIYHKDLSGLVAGEGLGLVISYKDYSLTDSLTMPAAPEITSPTATSQDLSSDITVSWDAVSPVPDAVAVFVDFTNTVSGSDYYVGLSGDSVSYTIPGGTLKTSGFGSCTIQVWAINKKALSGTGVDAESSYSVVNYDSVTITENN